MRSARSVLPPAPEVQQVFAENLERAPKSAGVARELLAAALDAWHLGQLADTAALVLSELVSNAIRHASGEGMRVSIARLTSRRVRVSVLDRDSTRPCMQSPDLDGVGGRGLFIVDAESVSWGVDLLPDGKRVWADLEAS